MANTRSRNNKDYGRRTAYIKMMVTPEMKAAIQAAAAAANMNVSQWLEMLTNRELAQAEEGNDE